MKTKITLLLILLMTFTTFGQGTQDLAAYSGRSSTAAVAAPNLSATKLKRVGGVLDALQSTYSSFNWPTDNAIDTDKYLEWSVSANSGYNLNISKIVINYDIDSAIGPLFGINYGDGPSKVRVRTSLDNYTTNILVNDNVLANGQTSDIPTNLNSGINGTITFRLYGFDADEGFLGFNLGRLSIDGELGTVLGLNNTGIKLEGTITETTTTELVYNEDFAGDGWFPFAPNANTGAYKAIVKKGNYTPSANINLNTLEVESLGNVTIPTGVTLSAVNTTLTSSSIRYPSLIVEGTGKINGSLVYKRHVNIVATPGSTTGANDLVSAPFSGQTFGAFAIKNANIAPSVGNPNNKFFGPFDKATSTYIKYNITSDAAITLKPGIGYRAASIDKSNFIFTAVGQQNRGVVTVPIEFSGPQAKEWNLIGNPYPSYIKLADFLAVNQSQFNDTAIGVYGYDGTAQDGWINWNMAYAMANPEAAITPGQGFLVASKAGGGNVTFRPSMRSTGTADDFIENRPNGDISHLKLQAISGDKTFFTDLYFMENASLGLDPGYDSAIYGFTAPSNFSLYSQLVIDNTGIDMAIQSVSNADLGSNVNIPIGLNASKGEQITISIGDMTLSEGIEVYLEDNVTNTFTLLNDSDYTFTADSKLSGIGRFFLSFSNSSLDIEPEVVSGLNIYAKSKIITIKGLLTETTSATVYDIQGRVISKLQLKANSTSNQLDLSQVGTGVYIIKLKNTALEKTQKMILK